LSYGCDPGIKLNNHFNVDKLPFINRKNKNKISAVAGLMNNKSKKAVKLDSPFSENFNVEPLNQHPSSVNPLNNNSHKMKDEKKQKQKEKFSINFIQDEKVNNVRVKGTKSL
jgi:hypothetical protein